MHHVLGLRAVSAKPEGIDSLPSRGNGRCVRVPSARERENAGCSVLNLNLNLNLNNQLQSLTRTSATLHTLSAAPTTTLDSPCISFKPSVPSDQEHIVPVLLNIHRNSSLIPWRRGQSIGGKARRRGHHASHPASANANLQHVNMSPIQTQFIRLRRRTPADADAVTPLALHCRWLMLCPSRLPVLSLWRGTHTSSCLSSDTHPIPAAAQLDYTYLL